MILNPDHRGQTEGGHYTYRPLIQYEPNDFPPDSRFWKNTANFVMDQLRTILKNDYPIWAEITWPGTTIQSFSWRQIAQMSQAALNACKVQITDIDLLAAAALAAFGAQDV